ncbi:archaeal/vacuolar-type H+-ATPase subunit C [Marinitoga piezophila KA3]|uniref:Archaeal/vacuolar-type H+-ATPase subunit C n=2 Tax=Marinitoga TaxID=160798 RepID=H2J5M2_MARPK|nr:V-type ATPase subunit [Marinitoga piezophila]AEX85008.1 archaeal/vacuolar-type H+-ATPase subunit C [Marinitoga piezophila KA3]NUU97167.1 ATPase [Marinitoga sp. 1138]
MKFPALMSKVKVLHSKILTEEDFNNLINTETVTEVTEYLKANTHYKEYFENVDISKLHRRDVEILIRQAILKDFYNIYFYLPVEGQRFFKLMEKRFEIENIKFILRSLHSEHPEYITEEKFFPLYHQSISTDTLLTIKSFDDALNVFKNSVYGSIFEPAYSNYQKNGKIQYLLNAFDFWYFTNMKSMLSLMPMFGKNLKYLFYEQMDLANIQWIYRSRILFKLSPEEVLNFLMPIHYRLTQDELRELANASNTDEFLAKLTENKYGEFFKNIDPEIFPYIIERLCERILLKSSRKLISHTQNGFDVMSGYLYIREYEYKDLITLIEGKRYKLPNEKIKEFLLLMGV